MEGPAARLAELELRSSGPAARGLSNAAGLRGLAEEAEAGAWPASGVAAADEARQLGDIYDKAQVHLGDGEEETALAMLLNFVGDWLCRLGPGVQALAKEERRMGQRRLVVALEQLLPLRQRLLAKWAKEEANHPPPSEAPRESEVTQRLYLRWSLARLRLNLWEGAVGPVEGALDRLCRQLLATHKARHGKNAGTKSASLSLTAVSVGLATTGPAGLVAAGPAIAAVAVAVGVGHLISDHRIARARARAKAEGKMSIAQLGLLTPGLLALAEELEGALLAEWADIRPTKEALEAMAASWRYDWWHPFAEAAEAKWGGVLDARRGDRDISGNPSFRKLAESSTSFINTTTKMACDTGKYMEEHVHGGPGAADGGTMMGFEASAVLTKAFGAALGVFDVVKSVGELRSGDPESAALVRRKPEMRRVREYADVVLDAFQAKLDGRSLGQERAFAAQILKAKFRCSNCWAVGLPLPCVGCGLWLSCAHCAGEERPHVCTGKGGMRGGKAHLWEAELALLEKELSIPLTASAAGFLSKLSFRQLLREEEERDEETQGPEAPSSRWASIVQGSLRRDSRDATAREVAAVERRFVQPTPKLRTKSSEGEADEAPVRRLVHQGVLQKLCSRGGTVKPRQFFLFNDLLVLGRPVVGGAVGGPLERPRLFPLAELTLQDFPSSTGFEHCWTIATATKTFAVSAASAEEKAEWLRLLEESCEGDGAEAAPLWAHDKASVTCQVCERTRFSSFRRRHHCRSCGRLVCAACSSQRLAGHRACLFCFTQHKLSPAPDDPAPPPLSSLPTYEETLPKTVPQPTYEEAQPSAVGRAPVTPLVAAAEVGGEAGGAVRTEPPTGHLLDLPVPPLPAPFPSPQLFKDSPRSQDSGVVGDVGEDSDEEDGFRHWTSESPLA